MRVEWSTDSFSPAERFEQWREACCQHVYALTPERDARTPFQGRLTRQALGWLDVADIRCDGHLVQRRAEDIRAHPSDTYYVYVQQRGATWFEQRGQRLTVAPGDIVIADPNVPFTTGALAFDFRLWRVDRARLSPLLALGDDALPMVHIAHDHGDNALIRSWLATLLQCSAGLSPAALDLAAGTLCALLANAVGLAPGMRAHGTQGRRAAQLVRVRQHMAQYAQEPGLGAGRVAREVGVSLRVLHQLFERSGDSFQVHLTALRLARAEQLLRDPAAHHLSAGDIGMAAGFGETSTFYRRFKARHGITPGDYRAA